MIFRLELVPGPHSPFSWLFSQTLLQVYKGRYAILQDKHPLRSRWIIFIFFLRDRSMMFGLCYSFSEREYEVRRKLYVSTCLLSVTGPVRGVQILNWSTTGSVLYWSEWWTCANKVHSLLSSVGLGAGPSFIQHTDPDRHTFRSPLVFSPGSFWSPLNSNFSGEQEVTQKARASHRRSQEPAPTQHVESVS